MPACDEFDPGVVLSQFNVVEALLDGRRRGQKDAAGQKNQWMGDDRLLAGSLVIKLMAETCL